MAKIDHQYTVLIHKAEEGGYWAEVEELPGCVSQGETLDDVNANILDALQACLEADVESVEWKMVANVHHAAH